MVALLVVFLLTRVGGAWLADHPTQYGRNVTGDVELYEFWANRMAGGSSPYTDVPVQYPPGLLPFILAPETPGDLLSYRTSLIGLMVIVDALGLFGLVLIAYRQGSLFGPWIWVIAVPLIGPLVYLRLDLVPAVATIWAIERLSRGAWAGAGAWLGLGTAAKLYPALLLPVAFICSPKRRRFLVGATVVLGLALLPFVLSPRGLIHNVFEYHAGRDVHIESSWGLLLLVGSKLGLNVSVRFSAESFNLLSPVSSAVRILALVSTVLTIGVASWFAERVLCRGDIVGLTGLMYATLAMSIALSTVFSPQFILWMLAPGAAALCSTGTSLRMPVLLLVPIAALTQWLYPFEYGHLLAVDARGLLLLALRDLLVLASASLAFVLLWKNRNSKNRSTSGLAEPAV
jgi:Glycosyltransferase family 87